VTIEVGDVAVERDPALEFCAFEARTAHPLPKNPLGPRRLLAQASGELNARRGDRIISRKRIPSPLPLSLRVTRSRVRQSRERGCRGHYQSVASLASQR
jgi:hypothetical protein